MTFPAEMCLYRSPDDHHAEPSYRRWNWASVLTENVWCHTCCGPRHVERIPSMAEFNHAAAVRRLPDQASVQHVEDELLELDDEQILFLATHLTKRSGPGRCLTCHGLSYLRLQVAIDRVVNMKHPDCGGALQLHQVFSNAIGPCTIRWFDVQGRCLGEQQERF
jgi:hypothetical protein